jgi:hypothetical protein
VVTELAEDADRIGADLVVVLDDEDCLLTVRAQPLTETSLRRCRFLLAEPAGR